MSWLSLVIVAISFVAANCYDDNDSGALYEMRMPSTRPQTDDLMLCYARRVDSPIYIVSLTPIHYDPEINHHIIIYGCGDPEPGQEQPSLDRIWNCGEMSDAPSSEKSSVPTYEKAPICFDGQPPSFVWSWAMSAPPFSFPEGVSYKVGTPSIRYLIMQVHYKNTTFFRPPSTKVDTAGVQIKTVSQPTPKLAGIFLLASDDGVLPPHEISYFDIACRMSEPGLNLHPFAFRLHAHGNGLVSSVYRVRGGRWTEIGRQSPQLPQTFYDVTNPGMTIRRGDILAGRCTYYNKESKPITIGGTQYNEMCNIYIYYYSTNGVEPQPSFCQSPGAPHDAWAEFTEGNINLAGVPKTVSVVPPPPPGVEPMNHHHHDDNNNNDKGTLQMVGTYQNNKVMKEGGVSFQEPVIVPRNWVEGDKDDDDADGGELNINGLEDESDNGDYYRSAYDPYAEEQEQQIARLLTAL